MSTHKIPVGDGPLWVEWKDGASGVTLCREGGSVYFCPMTDTESLGHQVAEIARYGWDTAQNGWEVGPPRLAGSGSAFKALLLAILRNAANVSSPPAALLVSDVEQAFDLAAREFYDQATGGEDFGDVRVRRPAPRDDDPLEKVLRSLIEDSDLEEVAEVLKVIAHESGHGLRLDIDGGAEGGAEPFLSVTFDADTSNRVRSLCDRDGAGTYRHPEAWVKGVALLALAAAEEL